VKSTVDLVDVRGMSELEEVIRARIAIEKTKTAALRRERDGLARCLAAVPAAHRALALAAYRQGHVDGQEYERTAHYESEGWGQP